MGGISLAQITSVLILGFQRGSQNTMNKLKIVSNIKKITNFLRVPARYPNF